MFEKVFDFLYPRNLKCIVCSKELNNDFICDECKYSIEFNLGRRCRSCGRNIYDDREFCSNCLSLNRYFDRGVSVCIYNDYIRKMMKDFKYKNKRYLGFYMAKYIVKYISDLDLDIDFDVIIPVPLHKDRLQKRNYNQSKIISDYLSNFTGLNTDNNLERIKSTERLYNLSLVKRKEVLEDAFIYRGFCDKNIILVDDIFTTGSTVNECSKILKQSGAKYILVASFAVGE